jgi:aspartate/methionine/tyrosine aminotransferase
MVTPPGALDGRYIVLQTILRPGDEALPPSPYYGH